MGMLDQVLGGVLGSSATRGGSSPIMLALMALLAQRGGMGGGVAGGLGGLLGSVTGGLTSGPGGAAGGSFGGLGGLLERFSASGHGEIANSWVGTGQNRPIAPDQLGEALGGQTVEDLSRHTGLPRQDLLAQLAQHLPDVVDKLTPHGRVPDAAEAARW